MLVWQDAKLLLIERAKFPFGFAIPAGHVDGDSSFEAAAQRELEEEVGLKVESMNLAIEGRKNNPCRREDGTWHQWKIFETTISGTLARSKEETKRAGWYSKEEISDLASRTEKYLAKEISEQVWEQNPGLEPVMYDWFKKLEII